tara:strand:+ start:24991 stop:25434 length:444 start_codon:yes stop_codon:yes gene_type:complete
MKYSLIFLLIFIISCTQNAHIRTHPVITMEDDEEALLLEAERLGVRPVDYLHYANNPYAHQPAFEIFGAHLIPAGTARQQLDALDEFQANPCLLPPCKCGRGGYGWRGFKGRLKCLPFMGAREAGNHQERLEAITEIQNTVLGASTQ